MYSYYHNNIIIIDTRLIHSRALVWPHVDPNASEFPEDGYEVARHAFLKVRFLSFNVYAEAIIKTFSCNNFLDIEI